jgi:predicted HicB family RNase H-like nuclease
VAGLNVDLPEDLHMDARVAAVEQGKTLKAFVIAAIAAAVERHKAERAKRG